MLKNSEDLKKITKGTTNFFPVVCDYCGKEFERKGSIIYKSIENKSKDACNSKECSTKKRKETCMAKYGVEIASKSTQSRSKSSLSKGGDGKSILDYKDYIIEQYNKNPELSVLKLANELGFHNSVLYSFFKDNNLKVNGNGLDKAKKTMVEKYGKEHYLQTEEGQIKRKLTNLGTYGDTNPYKNKEFKEAWKEKTQATCLKRYGVKTVVQDPSRQKEYEQKRKDTRIKNGQILYNNKTVMEWAKEKDMAVSSLYQKIEKHGLEYAIKTEKSKSYLEVKMSEWLNEMNIKFQTHFYVEKKIADFYIPEKQIIIECDGLMVHSEEFIEDNNYHVKKRQLYIDNGYFPLFFREDEINNKPHIIKSIVLNKLGLNTNRIFARDCKTLISAQTKQFFNNNHLMGNGRGCCFSLLYNNEVVSSMSINTINKSNGEYEISRFCNKLGTSIIGGYSKLLSLVKSTIKDMKILNNFVDLRYGSGDYLTQFGFIKKDSYSASFRWTNGFVSFPRTKFYSNTGYDQGFTKIWDCGQQKWVLYP